jgi:hypothetical protein
MIPEKIRSHYPTGIGIDSLLIMIEKERLHINPARESNAQDSVTAELRRRPLKDIVQDESVSDEMWLRFLRLENTQDENTRKVGLKLRKLLANEAYFVSYAFKNLPLMMLLAIPIFALLLKVLYIRHGRYYIEHVIHALHIHSFGYLLYSLATILTYTLDTDLLFIFLGFLCVTLYAYWSFRRVYRQGRFKTLIKFFFIGMVYFNLLMLLLIGELYFSVILF